jgi:hypothetical protein
MTINMKTIAQNVVSSYKRCKHKGCKTQTSKIKIIMTKKVSSSCSPKGGKKSWRSTWGPRLKRSWTINTKDARQGPLGPTLLAIVVKREQACNPPNHLKDL